MLCSGKFEVEVEAVVNTLSAIRRVSTRRPTSVFASLLPLLMLSLGAEAGPMGAFSVVGTGNVRLGNSFIDWGKPGPTFESASYPNCVSGPNPGACVIDGTTTGSSLFTAGTGSFALVVGISGTIADLEDDFAPTGAGFLLDNFLTGVPGMTFAATFIPKGAGTLAGCTNNVGDVCTIPGSALTITNLPGGGSNVSMAIQGIATDVTGMSSFEGLVLSQVGLTAAQFIALTQVNGYIQSSWSANFDVTAVPAATPEPSSLLLLSLGGLQLIGVAVHRRRSGS